MLINTPLMQLYKIWHPTEISVYTIYVLVLWWRKKRQNHFTLFFFSLSNGVSVQSDLSDKSGPAFARKVRACNPRFILSLFEGNSIIHDSRESFSSFFSWKCKAKQKIKKIVNHHKKSLEIPKRYGNQNLELKILLKQIYVPDTNRPKRDDCT